MNKNDFCELVNALNGTLKSLFIKQKTNGKFKMITRYWLYGQVHVSLEFNDNWHAAQKAFHLRKQTFKESSIHTELRVINQETGIESLYYRNH